MRSRAALARATVESRPAQGLYTLAKLGTAGKGLVYVGMAWAAYEAAFDLRYRPEDAGAVLNGIFHRPLGEWIVAAFALVMGCFVLWRLAAAIAGRSVRNEKIPAGMRLLLLFSAALHASIAWSAARLIAVQEAMAAGDGPTRATLRMVMEKPFGQTMILAAAGTSIIIGLIKFVRSYRGKVWDDLEFEDVALRWQKGITWLGRIGEVTRGIVFVTIGVYLGAAAARFDPSTGHGVAGALQAIQRLPWGSPALFVVATGLFSYGLFLVTSARYQKL